MRKGPFTEKKTKVLANYAWKKYSMILGQLFMNAQKRFLIRRLTHKSIVWKFTKLKSTKPARPEIDEVCRGKKTFSRLFHFGPGIRSFTFESSKLRHPCTKDFSSRRLEASETYEKGSEVINSCVAFKRSNFELSKTFRLIRIFFWFRYYLRSIGSLIAKNKSRLIESPKIDERLGKLFMY